jgi:23S rRNA (adenine2030-N6)-methyltransferase
MLSYLHQYHAGNFADLHKQLVLTEILINLRNKDKPFTLIDTHAGEGYYCLTPKLLKSHRELQSGLAPLFAQAEQFTQRSDCPSLIRAYVEFLKHWNPDNKLKKIPGSPLLLSEFLRNDSKLTICDKHPSVFSKLKENFSSKKTNFFILPDDGYQATKALLPPKEKRGLIFIDPSYEEKSEYENIAECVAQSIKRFSTGTYVIWYPILNNRSRDSLDWLIKKILKLPINALWQHEWYLEPGLDPEKSGFYALQGSGLLCIHLPWQSDNHLTSNFDWLNTHLFPGRKCKDTWLKQPE